MCQQTVAIVESDENNCPALHPGSGGFYKSKQRYSCLSACALLRMIVLSEKEKSHLLQTCSSPAHHWVSLLISQDAKSPQVNKTATATTVCFTVTVQSCLLARPYKYCINWVIQCFTVLLPCMKIVVIVPGYVSL